jgi:hypothetical protein
MFAFKQAHEKNMTFNDFVNQVLRDFIDKVNKGEYTKEEAQRWVAEGGQWPFKKETDEDQIS